MISRRVGLVGVLLLTILGLLAYVPGATELFFLIRLPLIWHTSAAHSVISLHRDGFDVTFRAYDNTNTSVPPKPEPAVVPPRLHHILLGASQPHVEWSIARHQCMRFHPGWESFLWDDHRADGFVQHHFPEYWEMWRKYPYLVQKVDALRYMVLYTYGGAVLDLDLECKRSLEPLRRLEFVAPAAHPVGFSIGMMMASSRNAFVKDLIRNLPAFNRKWLLPYATVMFSTGCHYASTIFTMQKDRSSLRILAGPPDNPSMHMLNGRVNTPLFRHFGSSSWHRQDAAFVKRLGEKRILSILSVLVMGAVFGGVIIRRWRGARRREVSPQKFDEKLV